MSEDENKVVSLSGARKKEDHQPHNKEENSANEQPVYCSFCGRPHTSVLKMIKGPGVNICSECTMICVQYLIIDDGGALSEDAKKLLQIFWQGKR